ncbi:MAG: site-specific DNA-methyltransferase [Firmicutes bacterium]|nr:site-specific DNA-methyltransferase [Bacillota bacterium]
MQKQLMLFPNRIDDKGAITCEQFHSEIKGFNKFGKTTDCLRFSDSEIEVPVYINEFWTSKQRAAHSLHEISYRACFKPQLPRFFITRLTAENDIVYDPFMGRGTTIIESALLGRIPIGCDINPLSRIITLPRLFPPEIIEVRERLGTIDLEKSRDIQEDLLVFYHPETLRSITSLRDYLLKRQGQHEIDHVDAWIRMVATNRLTGHSSGFFSVYTLPPNQAVSIDSQQRINEKRQQSPPPRNVRELIIKKSRSLLRKLRKNDIDMLRNNAPKAKLITCSADCTREIRKNTVNLVVTSPPFLDIVDYHQDNWLRCWFNGIDPEDVDIWHLSEPSDWQDKMADVFRELKRVLVPGGYVAFEVGEVRSGRILLETLAVPAALGAGLIPEMIMINSQVFTKTSNCWGVNNLKKGTNTNRIILLRKP